MSIVKHSLGIPYPDGMRTSRSTVWRISTILICCFISLLSLPSTSAYDITDWQVFENPYTRDGSLFEKMVIDPSTSRLYIGAMNHLFDLKSDSLTIRVQTTTGPLEDSELCRGGKNDSCNEAKHPYASHCKSLAVYDKSSKLIECTSLFQGRCRLRNLHNISEALAESSEPMVANDATSSTVVFVGDGPSERPVLYVASTFVKAKDDRGQPFREDIPAVASLSLTKSENKREFDKEERGLATGTFINLERKHRSNYRIDYVGGFESGDYAYFATRQRSSSDEENPIQSRLTRVCTGDKDYYSYTEVPLECSKGDIDYNLLKDVYVTNAGYELAKSLGISESDQVVYGVFQQGDPSSTRRELAVSRSALCLYPIRDVEKKFQENIMDCYRGSVYKNLDWFKSADLCTTTRLTWSQVKCGNEVNKNIGGRLPIKAEPVLEYDARFTAIAINTTHSSTVAFIGTDNGTLVKAAVQSAGNAFVYDSVVISQDEEILPDIEFSDTGKHVYILTPSKVVKMPSSNCASLSSHCGGCLSQKDPYCGWCVLSSQCTEEAFCEKNLPLTKKGWLNFQNNLCPNIKSVMPDRIQVTTADFLNVTIENIGEAKGRLRCTFRFDSGHTVDSETTSTDGGGDGSLRCATPPFNRIPTIPPNSTHIPAILSITVDGRSTPIASTNFTFYDCGKHTSCSTCASSPFPCDWCLEGNECVDGKLTEDKCRKQHIINGMMREGTSRRRGPQHCPHIKSPHDKVYVAAGERRNISVKVQNVDPSFMADFRCLFYIGTVIHDKLATRTSEDDIICDEMQFDHYAINGGVAPVPFQIVWSSTESDMPHPLDNSNGVSVEVYRCDQLASNCGICLTLDTAKFDCGWCTSEERCVRPSQCPTRLRPSGWLNSTQMCPNPKIYSFTPKKGPLGGKTKVHIVGKNLGRSAADLNGAITVANVPCTVVPSDSMTPSAEIVCRTGAASVKGSKAPVVVSLRPSDRSFVAISSDQFTYVEPEVTHLSPQVGPISGGTDVTIYGRDLDAGSDVVVRMGHSGCTVVSRNEKQIQCRTNSSDESGDRPIFVLIDSYPVRLHGRPQYRFADTPRVSTILPDKSIVGGGVLIDVEGSGFKLLQRPSMVLFGDNKQQQSGPVCLVDSDSLMLCRSPPLPKGGRVPTNGQPVPISYAINFDGTLSEKKLLHIYSNPKVHQFPETRFYRPGENTLTINAEDLTSAATDRDIKVTVGGAPCNLTAVASRVLTCHPPSSKPPLSGSVQPEVIVRIGDVSFSVGELSYDTQSLSSPALFAIALIILVMVGLLLLLIILYKRKSNSHQRQMKYLKHQMDTIEMKVATECKEAFAELQTSLNAYTADLPLGTPIVPFLEYKDYAARVLFPNNFNNHPVLRELEVDSTRAAAVETGLREFHKLIMNKTFLLTWVRVMESNKYFLGKDRVYVGSLLMVVLQEKMGYCTEILKQLLRELIEKTVEKKFQPKILFRRSESVAERMLAAWFTFLMHKYLQECAGKKLYELYFGIKQQMEKGPQDAVTLEARYSLSEEKLLRATFDFHELTVFVAGDSTNYSHPDIPVRVLDCDTITQVKEKCLEAKYRTVPFSERPSVADLDMEWRTGVNGRILLQDVDSTSRIDSSGWKHLNTLSHYQVPNNAVLALLTKQSSLYNLVNFNNTLSLLSERSEKSTLSLKNSPTLSRPFGTSSSSHSKDAEGGHKLYHLVKPTEHGPSDNQEKMVTEIYLTRLLMMKGTLQKFINDLLESIFSTGGRSCALPACIKYMFDFMDEQALEHEITDPEVVHAWKSNALPLRFWVNLIKNPHFIFDIPKPTKVEGCLSVVAQTLMDACSTQDHQLTKDSPSSKLLFAKDMYQYRDWVDSYYSEIQRMPQISDQDMSALLNEESRVHRGQFHVFSALNELYKYLDQYRDALMEALEQNEHAQTSRLPGRLQDMLAVMESHRVPDYDSSTIGMGYNSNSRLMPR